MCVSSAASECSADCKDNTGAADPTDAELDEGELCFMEDLVDILEASHFRLLSAEDWETAQAEEFTVGAALVSWQACSILTM